MIKSRHNWLDGWLAQEMEVELMLYGAWKLLVFMGDRLISSCGPLKRLITTSDACECESEERERRLGNEAQVCAWEGLYYSLSASDTLWEPLSANLSSYALFNLAKFQLQRIYISKNHIILQRCNESIWNWECENVCTNYIISQLLFLTIEIWFHTECPWCEQSVWCICGKGVWMKFPAASMLSL